MSEEKQIEKNCNECLHFEACCKWTDFPKQIGFPTCRKFAPISGYRKQGEGEWKLGKSGCMYFCSSCGYAAHPREEEEWSFCPHCGAKMKGGAE